MRAKWRGGAPLAISTAMQARGANHLEPRLARECHLGTTTLCLCRHHLRTAVKHARGRTARGRLPTSAKCEASRGRRRRRSWTRRRRRLRACARHVAWQTERVTARPLAGAAADSHAGPPQQHAAFALEGHAAVIQRPQHCPAVGPRHGAAMRVVPALVQWALSSPRSRSRGPARPHPAGASATSRAASRATGI